MNKQGWENKKEANQYQCQNEFPYPFDPRSVWYLSHTDAGDKYTACGGNHVGKTITKLECQHGGLAADVDEVGKLCHDGHR